MKKLTPQAIEAAQNLIVRYEQFLADLPDDMPAEQIAFSLKEKLGFGCVSTCTLCKASVGRKKISLSKNCKNCIHSVGVFGAAYPCITQSYYTILLAGHRQQTRDEVIDAIKDRMNLLKTKLEMYEGIQRNRSAIQGAKNNKRANSR